MLSIGSASEITHGRRWRALAMAVVAVLATAFVSVTTAAPAEAAPADCLNGANGFVNTPSSVPGAQTARSRSLGSGVSVELRYGTISGVQRGWARIVGAYVSTDRVWMDWSTNGGASWIQCGPFDAGSRQFTPAQRTSSSTQWVFRACGRLIPPNTQSLCTAWW
jgi:hypothetical protein